MTDRDLERLAQQAASHPNARVGARMLRHALDRYRAERRQADRRRKAMQHEPIPTPRRYGYTG